MTEPTLEVPKKPTDMAAFWPADGRKEINKRDGVYIQYRDIQIGPFPNRTEASWYDGQLQEIIAGWIDKSRFVGRIFPFGDAWYVERWETNDGPFTSLAVAWDHRQAIYIEYRQAIDRYWDQSNGNPADIQRQKQWSKVPVEAMDSGDDINFNVAKILAEPRMIIPESLRPKADIPEETTDDVQQFDLLKSIGYGVKNMKWGNNVNSADIRQKSSLDLEKDADDPTSNYRGYAVSYTKGVIHVDPVTNKLHRDDHICNQQCRDLAARAQAEYKEDVRRTGGYIDNPTNALKDELVEEEQARPLTQGDIPALMCLMMDRLGITEFQFTVKELMEVDGRISLEHEDLLKSSYMMKRSK